MRRLLLALALCGMAHAATPPRLELSVTPAWKGWTRPGRATEVDLRVASDSSVRVALDVSAGAQSVHAELELQPGRTQRLQIPVAAAEKVAVSAAMAGAATPQRRDVALAKSESPLLGLALASAATVQLEGFHAVALVADDLPRNASAYSSIDALILDAPTLAALDQRQLGALLAHAVGCGRIVVLNTDERLRRLLDGAGGCGGRALLNAASLAEARELLKASLSSSLPGAMTPGGAGELQRPGPVVWQRVALLLAVYGAGAALATLFFSSLPALLLAPAVATVAALALLHTMPPPAQLFIWSEGESGASTARYQAWQQLQGLVRARVRMPIPPQLASSATPCDAAEAVQFEFDAGRGRLTSAAFDTRLFHPSSLCYSGSFPMARSVAVEARSDGSRQLRNTGNQAWPEGVAFAAGRAHDLPALAPGAAVVLGTPSDRPAADAVLRTAMTRVPIDGVAALWALDLGGVADVPIASKGWLLVSVPPP